MFRSSVFAGALWLHAATLAHAADKIGFREAELDVDSPRSLHAAFWYPTRDRAATVAVGENRVFYGTEAIWDAATAEGVRPLVVLSHGYGGSWRNLNWLAAKLRRPTVTTWRMQAATKTVAGRKERSRWATMRTNRTASSSATTNGNGTEGIMPPRELGRSLARRARHRGGSLEPRSEVRETAGCSRARWIVEPGTGEGSLRSSCAREVLEGPI
ncbi:hypothetical protein [Ensifer adhaerens]|uniref:hypothetical protein n=1 Tax=Ensifer adhaerens TaxID=106592 RepID=UPI001177DC84|nr:hypothetical protein [Ensifer adhaerens]